MDPLVLARNWNISVGTAQRTIQCKIRLFCRNKTTITMNKWYASNDRMIKYTHLICVMFSDTKFAFAKAGKSVQIFHVCRSLPLNLVSVLPIIWTLKGTFILHISIFSRRLECH